MENVRLHSYRYLLSALIIAILGLFLVTPPAGASKPVPVAPDFTGTAIDGAPVHLSDYKGKIVVLEWTNPGCPFVVKHYKSGNMQALQKDAMGKGIVWLSINSSAEGKEGYLTAETAEATLTGWRKGNPTAYLLDPSGEIGRLYDAKTTPHMFVIDQAGILVYQGAIDDKPTFDLSDVTGARNYVQETYDALIAGTQRNVHAARPYGCSVKY